MATAFYDWRLQKRAFVGWKRTNRRERDKRIINVERVKGINQMHF